MRLGAGLLVIGVLVARLGTGPFVAGVRSTGIASLLVATGITAVTTVCSAWRWWAVASALGAHVAPRRAVAAVYRAQFLNVALPGGVLGDVDRAVGHGRDLGRLGTAVRAVVWERTLGQVVQVTLTAFILLAFASPVRAPALAAGAVAAVAAGFVVLGLRRSTVLTADVRRLLRPRTTRRVVALASIAATTGHLLVFLVAARAAGAHAPVQDLLPLAALVLLASALPLNVAGWGPREGVAAWAFGVAGLGASTGLAVSVAYGVLAAVATIPGGIVLLAGRGTRSVRAPAPMLEEAVHG